MIGFSKVSLGDGNCVMAEAASLMQKWATAWQGVIIPCFRLAERFSLRLVQFPLMNHPCPFTVDQKYSLQAP